MNSDVLSEERKSQHSTSPRSAVLKPLRYGLPCANCKIYYAAELNFCPVCDCAERVPADESERAGRFDRTVTKTSYARSSNFTKSILSGQAWQQESPQEKEDIHHEPTEV